MIFENIKVFKTNINSHNDVLSISTVFQRPDIDQWNVDVWDCDKVLRVVTANLSCEQIILLVQQSGYQCSELPD